MHVACVHLAVDVVAPALGAAADYEYYLLLDVVVVESCADAWMMDSALSMQWMIAKWK